MGRTYKSAQGKQIDMEKLRLQNELVPAIGNMRVNARGDQLGPGGQIVKTREQMLDEHYKKNVSKNPSRQNNDVIPTRGGKAASRETLEADVAPQTAPAQEKPVEPDLTPPAETAEEPAPQRQGGLAKAMAQAEQTEEQKSKPKRL
jgi:hypothetical protein